MADPVPDLAALAGEVAAELADVASTRSQGVIVYQRGSTEFARVSGSALEVRLPADIAAAALHTSDTTAVGEPGWIRFEPRDDERHVTDRAAAWFQTAWRHADR